MDPRPTHFKSGLHEIVSVFIICMAQFLTQGSITMSLSTMNIVLDSFAARSGTPVQSSERVWLMGSFPLTVGTFILISGKLGDIFGLKKMLVVGWIWCFVWSLISGLSYYSDSIIFFIICRAFQGIGFALLLPCAMGLLGRLYSPGSRKNWAFGCVGASGPSGAATICLMAAVVGQLSSWPWEFYLMSIVCFVFGVASILCIPDLETSQSLNSTDKPTIAEFDFIGSCLGVSGLILFNFVWNQGPIAGWDVAYIIALLVVSVLLIIAFFVYELKFAPHPLLPRAIFNYKIGLVLATLCFGWGSFGIWQYYYWSILWLRRYTPIEGGLTYLPFLVLGIIAAFSCSFIISKTKPSYILLAASVAFMCGDIMCSVMPVHQSYFQISFGQMFLLTWGMDLSFPAASLILSDYLPPSQQGMAGSLVSTVINFSVSVFLGMGSTVETEVMKRVHDQLKSYRSGLYFGIGVAALAVITSCVFIITQHVVNDSAGTFVNDQNLTTSSSDPEKQLPSDSTASLTS